MKVSNAGTQFLAALVLTLCVSSFFAPVASAQVRIANTTAMTHDPGHGTQVEYFGADGRSYLWYPGNRNVVPALWKLQGNNLCFLYPRNSYDAITKVPGGKWECRPYERYATRLVERGQGDMFGLARKAGVPFILRRDRTTLATLAAQIR